MEDTRRPWFAWVYRHVASTLDRHATGTHRSALVDGLSGSVVEIGAGTGLTFARYRAPVAEVTAVEPEPTLRARAQQAAAAAAVPVTVQAGVAEALPLPAGTADAAVSSLVLCTVDDPAAALGELARVLRPGGTLRLYEHVRAQTGGLAASQWLLDPLWSRLAGGCHMSRDPLGLLDAAGFTLVRVERMRVPASGPTLPPSPHILAEAVRR